ncbi:hypothetical protein MINS_01590 [Mycolicibacterium insubricum]|jgi:hypothetical protein|uniref:Uncharacterized protein n=1 Tax=Mycolicibacterium insubricum TaxID=444597 RepID=A0A1X0DLT1_9MYCO|nr:PE-PPE domain-containing protein [Mycolicibacterium insubricum]MCV7080055.1 PE-PPE domain-containing protein [Mycolicibacterium insubricum]ORA73363.1 hypothetical protein BST26_02900 [Mycolicibacterium insubricum]BBZ64730.1 hypothetical protein MINS_01590 [Mycolicibacterium insubricum]
MSQPTPPSLLKAKLQTIGMAGAAVAVTAGLTMAVTSAPEVIAASDHAIAVKQMQEDVNLAASIGIYPVGPGAQIMRALGMGSPSSALSTLSTIAGFIPGGESISGTLQQISDLLVTLQDGIDIPGVGNIAFPEIGVPELGPAGTYDAIAGLDTSVVNTLAIYALLKPLLLPAGGALLDVRDTDGNLTSLPLNTAKLDAAIGDALEPSHIASVLADAAAAAAAAALEHPFDPTAGPRAFAEVVNNYFGEYQSSIAVPISWGFGGTNTALALNQINKDTTGAFDHTVILEIALRNASRTGGGIASLLTPVTDLVGINMSNPNNVDANGNVVTNTTVWDITAAYDIMSDAPSTILNPVAWANSAAGAVAPTYLIPKDAAGIANFVEGLTQGNVDLEELLNAVMGLTNTLHSHVGEDGNLYITYDSGNLPLLQPFQAAPQLLSLIPGFKITTPVSSSLDNVLRQMVAMGYQDVDLKTVNGEPVFERGFDEAGTQAKFWTSPVSFVDGLQAPQALFDAVIGNGTTTGITGNLLSPDKQKLELFGNSALGDALYGNGLTTAVAGALKQVLLSIKTQLNPIFDAVDSNSVVKQIAQGLDQATAQVNGLIDQGGGAIKGLNIDLATPLMDGNRAFNKLTNQIGDAISGATQSSGTSGLINNLNATGTTSPNTLTGSANRGVQPQSIVAASAEQDQIGSGTPTTKLTGKDFLSNLGTGNNARAIAQALKGGSGSGTTSGLQRQLTKSQNSLTGAQERTKAVTDKLGQGDLKGAVQEVGKNIENRAKRAEQDVNNGLAKVGIKPNKKGSDDSPSKVAPKKETKTEHKTDHAA